MTTGNLKIWVGVTSAKVWDNRRDDPELLLNLGTLWKVRIKDKGLRQK